jgi:hypothetical protein
MQWHYLSSLFIIQWYLVHFSLKDRFNGHIAVVTIEQCPVARFIKAIITNL